MAAMVGSADTIVSRYPVESERQHELAGASGPAERRLRFSHPVSGAHDTPEDVRQAGPALAIASSNRRRASIWAPLRSGANTEPP
jgi:hypothetical protein